MTTYDLGSGHRARFYRTSIRPRVDKHELQERFRWEVSA
jgi:hypothetical protein